LIVLLVRLSARAISQAAARASKSNRTRGNLSENQHSQTGTLRRYSRQFHCQPTPVSLTTTHRLYTSWRFLGLSLSPPLRQRCRSRIARLIFQMKPNGTRRTSPRHLAMSSQSSNALKGGYEQTRAAVARSANLPFPNPSVFFHVRSEQAPASRKTVSSGFKACNEVVAPLSHQMRLTQICNGDEPC
jgi:hypothetical protein